MNSPITGKPMDLRMERFEINYLGKIITYLHTSYYCELTGELFTTTELDEVNLERIKKR